MKKNHTALQNSEIIYPFQHADHIQDTTVILLQPQEMEKEEDNATSADEFPVKIGDTKHIINIVSVPKQRKHVCLFPTCSLQTLLLIFQNVLL